MFANRAQAGLRLAERLYAFRDCSDCIVIGLPRGGVVCAFEVAKALNLPLDIIVPRKIGAPGNAEFAIGAISEEGERVFDREVIEQLDVDDAYIEREVEREGREARRRLRAYRGDRPPVDLKDRTAILVDDGVATGATMLAAIASARAKEARRVVVAIPVIPPDALAKIQAAADEVVYLAAPTLFGGVGMFYDEFEQTDDREVVDLLRRAVSL